MQWARVVMNQATTGFVSKLDYRNMAALEISGSAWREVPFKSYDMAAYPTYDVCEHVARRPDNRGFDIIICEQVLEHVRWPWRAARYLHASLEPGGYLVINVPFLVRMHPTPEDNFRWSESGLRLLLEEGGFKPEHMVSGAWGNRACVEANFDSFLEYEAGKHSLDNDPTFPIVAWAIARRQP